MKNITIPTITEAQKNQIISESYQTGLLYLNLQNLMEYLLKHYTVGVVDRRVTR